MAEQATVHRQVLVRIQGEELAATLNGCTSVALSLKRSADLKGLYRFTLNWELRSESIPVALAAAFSLALHYMNNKDTLKMFNKKLVGMTVRQAMDAVADDKMKIRLVEKSGQALVCTRDFRTDRLNVSVHDGKIVEVKNIG